LTSRLQGARVLILLETLELGGAERQAVQLAQGLAQDHGALVTVLGFQPPGAVLDLCGECGVVCRQIFRPTVGPWLFTWRNILRFARALRVERPTLLLPFTYFPNLACGLVWRWTGARLCAWNQRDVIEYRLGRGLDRLAQWQTPEFVANSGAAALFLEQYHGIPRRKIRVIHNGIQLPSNQVSRDAERERLGLAPGMVAVCMVANFTPHKDHETLVRAWQLVEQQIKDSAHRMRLFLVGRLGETSDTILALVQALGLTDHVIVRGFERDVSRFLSAMDVGVLSSHTESFPNGLLECMAAGLPVLATDLPGTREVVGPLAEDQLVPAGDVMSWSRRLFALLQDGNRRASLGCQNRARVAETFSVDAMTHHFASLAEEYLMR
jgi:glycosyltransferase involved in cell wall biosynthesis